MIERVLLSGRAERDIERVPRHIQRKLQLWIEAVQTDGLEVVRRNPGTHDEPLHGKREGQRSIRLSRSYRALYTVTSGGGVELVRIEEVSKHAY